MSNRSHQSIHRIALFFFNYSSIFCFKFENKQHKISNFLTALNLLKMPLVSTTGWLIIYHRPFKQKFFIENLFAMKDFSQFARVSFVIVIAILNLTSYLLSILQMVKREEIKIFVNAAFDKSLDGKYFLKFRKNCIETVIWAVILYSINAVGQFTGNLKISILTILACIILYFPSLLISSFEVFVKIFENFVVATMKQFRKDLKNVSNRMLLNHNQSVEEFLRLSRKHQEIYDLVERFNKNLGLQQTLIICFLTSMMVFSVSLILKSNLWL